MNQLDKRNSFWLSIQYTILITISFINLKINLVHFGSKIFGIWLLFTAFWGVGNVLDFGFGTAIVKYVAFAAKNENEGEINIISSTGVVVFLFIGMFLFILGNVSAYFIFYNRANLTIVLGNELMKLIFIFIGISFLFRYMSIFYKSVLEGFSNFRLTSKISIVNSILILLGVVVIYLANLNLIFLAVWYALVYGLILIFYLLIMNNRYNGMKIRISLFSFSKAKSMISFSLSVQTVTILGTLIDPIIKYLLGNFSSLNLITFYEVARRFSTALSGLFATSFRTFLPKSSVLKNKKEFREFVTSEATKLSSLGVAYSGVVYGIFSILFIFIIELFFGYKESVIIFFLLSLSESVNNSSYALYVSLIGYGKAFYLIITQAFQILFVCICVILGLVLFKNYLGLFGYYIASVFVFVMLIVFVRRESGFNMRNYLQKINSYKIFTLNLLTIGFIISVFFYDLNVYLIGAFLALLSLILFFSEIRKYQKLLANNIFRLSY